MSVFAAGIAAAAIGGAAGYLLARRPGGNTRTASRPNLMVNAALGGLIGFALAMLAPHVAASIRSPVWHNGITQVVSDSQLNDVIAKADGRPVLVYFYAPWCVPCNAMAPNVDKLAQSGRTVLVVNVDSAPRLAQLYNVRSVPTIYIFSAGKIQYSGLGYHSFDTLQDLMR